MSAQAAARVGAQAAKSAAKSADGHVLNKGAKRDPELYVSETTKRIWLYRSPICSPL